MADSDLQRGGFGDGDLDMVVESRAGNTNLEALYAQLLVDDSHADGVLDSTRQEAEVSLTGQTLDQELFQGTNTMDLFLTGKSLRELLDALFEPIA